MTLNRENHLVDKNEDKYLEETISKSDSIESENKLKIISEAEVSLPKKDIDNGFDSFGFSESILSSLENKGYKTPTPIQKAAIPELMLGRDLLGQAQTGTCLLYTSDAADE